ncbi:MULTISPECIES: autotransporter domain-containing protein [unclassified Pantoea]|uniref:autotransporter domain-containing protein n=1 Tax=unclassified Pantoea TaxID=2630326 RepID=UPI0023DA05AF|nr:MULTISPECIES: autotransporter domain-containing protein [unclassified Pantoea]MDF2043827.1 autotransporter domain-containing protein [Pantoea sp. Cr_R14]MDF2069826.1 autotransporter domain-containing protein [Pantoea sp. Cr_R13]MDF2081429.1 autotransporter domain-containing protein [Pantoea sp. Cr_R21]
MLNFISWRRMSVLLVSAVLSIYVAPAVSALSNGCIAVNALSGSTSLSFSANKYPASDFLPGDALSISFTDSGSASGGIASNADSVGLARANLSSFQTYNAANSTGNSPHTVTMTVPTGSLETNGLAVRADTSHGQISNLVFNCTSAASSSSDATLSGLSLSASTLSPSFSSGTSSYSASVANSVTSVTVTPVVSESHATVTVNGAAVASGSASQSISLDTGSNTVSVLVTAQDGTTRSYSITITRGEAPPVSADSSATVPANSANNTIPLALSGGTSPSVTLVMSPAHGSATVSRTMVTYTPVAGYSGSDSFVWHASNSGGTSADATVSITVSAPTLTLSPAVGSLPSATAGTAWSQTLTVSGGTAPYTWSSTILPPGISLNASSGTLSGIPSASGSYSFQATATDALGATGGASYTLSVSAAAPLASDSAATVAANSSANSLSLSLSGGAAISISINTLPAHGSATVSGIGITYTPAAGYSGNDSLTYTASNSSGTSASARISVSVSPSVLTLSPPGGALQPATAGIRWTQTVTAGGGTAPYGYTAVNLPAGLTLSSATGELSGTPVVAGIYSFQVTASDSRGASGTSSYTLKVSAAAQSSLQLQPAGGPLPQATAGKMYTQALSVTGGTAPYRWQLNGVPPAGLSFADGQLSGLPQAAGNGSFAVQVTDASGNTVQSDYTLSVVAAAPQATDHSATLVAGQSVTVSLTDGATGGPFTSAQLLDQPDSSLGSAAVRTSGNDFQLFFTAAGQASGTLALRYVLTGPAGTTSPAQVLLTIAARPNPAQDADVIGMVSAQFRAAQNFARAQLRNFSDRLEQLHSGKNIASDMTGIRYSLPSARPEYDADQKMWATAWQQQKAFTNDIPAQPLIPSLPFSSDKQAQRLSWWTGGYVDFGGDNNSGIRFSHTTVGVTTGADYRFSRALTAGLGIGFGRDVSDIGDSGTRTNGRAFSSALYGSYHPNAFFVDGLLGHGLMDFDSRRVITGTTEEARGSRSGRQIFSSLTSGYDFRTPDSLLSPYARLQYTRTWFDGYSETGVGTNSLAFAPKTFSQVTAGAGLRGEHRIPAHWGDLRLQARVEYAQAFSDSGSAHVGYADTADDTWRVQLTEPSRQTVTMGTGIDFLLPHNITPGIAYQGMLGLDAQHTREQMMMIRVNIGF